MNKPAPEQLTDYFARYINQVEETNLLNALIDQHNSFVTFLKLIPANKETYRYAEGKWNIKEVIQHIIDTERVFAYRALSFSRKDAVVLPAFDQDAYVQNSNISERSMNDLIHELDMVRHSTICLFKSFSEEQLHLKGVASGKESTPLILGFAIAGHCTHHHKILLERYL
jgi:DinB superfamily